MAAFGMADDNRSLGDRTRQYLTDLVRLDTSNPPGNETRVADYLKKVCDSFGIQAEELGSDPKRMNFVARLLRSGGKNRPLLLMAHSDVFPVSPAEAKQWTADPFGGELKNGYIYGRGTLNANSLLASELAVMVEIKRRNLKLNRDVILVSETDGEAGMTGIQWLIQNGWSKIDAEFALNDGGSLLESKDGAKVFGIQTMEKIPTRVILTAHGTPGTAALPRPDNPIVHLDDAVSHLFKADQPVRVNPTTRRYLGQLSTLSDYAWLAPLLPKLDNPLTAPAAAAQIRAKDLELDAMLHTTITPLSDTLLDVRRMPSETREDVLARLRQIINDPSVDVAFAPGPPMPTAQASPRTTDLYKAMERAIARIYPRDAVVTAYMSRGATDSGFLRSRGVPVYGVPLFLREPGEPRVRGPDADERITPKALDDGVELLWQIVLETAGEN
jgi:acetylornithine deacetylase/succinyl-diaminopimelate desuccinylase-like protein